MPIALLIADDHKLVREGLRQTFARTDVAVVAEAASVAEARRSALGPAVDVVLLDLNWSRDGTYRAEGFALLEQIRAARAQLPVLMYSIRDGRECIERCRHLGAAGYLVKGVDDWRLVTAVHAVYEGHQVWPWQSLSWPARSNGRPRMRPMRR